MGMVDEDKRVDVLANMVSMVDRLLKINNDDREEFWGKDYLSIIDAIATEKIEEISHSVTLKILEAGKRFHDVRDLLGSNTATVLLEAISKSGPHSTIEYEEQRKCPACGLNGWLLCAIERGETKIEYDQGPIHHDCWHVVERMAVPLAFECPVCNLDLEGDELHVAGLGDEFEIDDDEATDYEVARYNGEAY